MGTGVGQRGDFRAIAGRSSTRGRKMPAVPARVSSADGRCPGTKIGSLVVLYARGCIGIKPGSHRPWVHWQRQHKVNMLRHEVQQLKDEVQRHRNRRVRIAMGCIGVTVRCIATKM